RAAARGRGGGVSGRRLVGNDAAPRQAGCGLPGARIAGAGGSHRHRRHAGPVPQPAAHHRAHRQPHRPVPPVDRRCTPAPRRNRRRDGDDHARDRGADPARRPWRLFRRSGAARGRPRGRCLSLREGRHAGAVETAARPVERVQRRGSRIMAQFFRTERGQRIAWYLYDFGNSAYAAVIILAIYSAYFKEGVVGGAEGSRLWGISVAIAMLVTVLISPVLGAIADRLAIKKRMLAIFTAISVAFTGCLFFVGQGDVFAGMAFFILAEIGYRAAQVYYDALLPEIAPRNQIGRISGRGWAIGSAGGILCLAAVLPLVVLVGGNFVLRLALAITALWYLVFSLPLILFVREKARPKPLAAGESIWTIGFKQLWATLRRLRDHREYVKFMV